MKSLRKRAPSGVAAALLLLAVALSGQEPGPLPTQSHPPAGAPAKPATTPQQKVGIVVTTEEVVVPVTVKDRNGNLVAGLVKEDFRVFEDSVEQNIKQLKTEAFPLSMVVLVDNDLKQKDAAQVNPSLVSLIGGLALDDEADVCLFDQFFHEGKGFTKNQDKLVVELQRTDLATRPGVGPMGDPFGGPTLNNAPITGAEPVNDPTLRSIKGQPTKALDDAVYNSAMLLKERDSKKRRKIILLISDGQNGAKFNTHSYAETRAELLRQGIAVYSVAPGSAYLERKFNRLVEYPKDTGGDVYFGVKQNTLSELYSRITEEARNQYTLIYSPQGERKVDYHTIEVRVRRPDMTILAREGYYGGTLASEGPK